MYLCQHIQHKMKHKLKLEGCSLMVPIYILRFEASNIVGTQYNPPQHLTLRKTNKLMEFYDRQWV